MADPNWTTISPVIILGGEEAFSGSALSSTSFAGGDWEYDPTVAWQPIDTAD
jgi:hypothetical protein